jgi:hypothetical protein
MMKNQAPATEKGPKQKKEKDLNTTTKKRSIRNTLGKMMK